MYIDKVIKQMMKDPWDMLSALNDLPTWKVEVPADVEITDKMLADFLYQRLGGEPTEQVRDKLLGILRILGYDSEMVEQVDQQLFPGDELEVGDLVDHSGGKLGHHEYRVVCITQCIKCSVEKMVILQNLNSEVHPKLLYWAEPLEYIIDLLSRGSLNNLRSKDGRLKFLRP